MDKIKIIFHEAYLNYSFGPGHPFWPERARVFLAKLKRHQFPHEIMVPKKADEQDVLLVHSRSYINRLKLLAKEKGRLAIDTPVTIKNLESAYFSVGGSILALEQALQGQRAINLAGGWHHAGIGNGSGFCLLNVHSIAVKKLQKEGRIKKAMIFDLDVHAGQGTQEIFYSDPKVFTVSIHQDPATLYPGVGFTDEKGKGAGKGFNLNIPLAPDTGEDRYLETLDSVLPLTKKFPHDMIILVLGVDTFEGDPLANINLNIDSYRKIGERFKRFPKVAVMFAGGYSKKTPDLWFSFLKGFI